MSFIQLEGNIKFGTTTAGTDYSSAITSLVINRTAEIITTPATFADATTDPHAGAETQTLDINFLSDPTSASSFWSLLYDAMDTDTKILYWSATLTASTTVSATNPQFSGQIVVSQLGTGGTVGQNREQSASYPIKAGTLAKATE